MTRITAAMAVLGLLLATSTGGMANAAEGNDDETKKICAAAAKRYQQLFGDKPPAEGTAIVLQYKYTFCPKHLTVKAGTTVRWINVDKRTSHSVWLKAAGREESERMFPEETWEIKFNDPGEFPYLCGPHWEREKMTGTLTVIR